MPRIKSEERVVEYTSEFKVKIVDLTNRLNVCTTEVAEVLGLHPVMVYRWRQECREGRLVSVPSRRISMTKKAPSKSQAVDKELKRLRKEVAKLEKENDFLKKWDGYLKAQKRKDLDS